jgi:hypothetical protein
MIYQEFDGFAELIGNYTIIGGGTLYHNVTLNIEGEQYSTPLIAASGAASDYFYQGKKGKYFYIKCDDLKEKMPKLRAIHQPDLVIYAVITEDGEYVFDLKSLIDAEMIFKKTMKILYSLFLLFLFISILTIPIIIGVVGLIWLFFKYLPLIKVVKEAQRRADIKKIKRHLADNNFDLNSTLVTKKFGWEKSAS